MYATETENPTESTAQAAEAATTEGVTEERIAGAVPEDLEVTDEDTGDDLGDAAAPTSSGVLSGAAAVVGAGLGLASLSGTWLGTLMADRQQVIGQIKAQTGTSANPIVDIYGTPWHTTALFNGLFALAAVIVAGAVLMGQQFTAGRVASVWVKSVAWGAFALGVIGLLIAGAMWFDLFAALPTVPTRPAGPMG